MTDEHARGLIHTLFDASPSIRYVALYQAARLTSEQRGSVAGASDSESDRYEELLVNPGLLTLAKQRGDIDCGGLRFLIVAYGNFFQLVRAYGDGHLSVCLELSSNPIEQEVIVRSVVDRQR
jgi:hypothetical protein